MPKGVYRRYPGMYADRSWSAPCDESTLRRMYEDDGMSQSEIASALGCSLKRVQTAMRRFNIQPRRQVKRNQWRENNPCWKGDRAGYQAKHIRLYNSLGQPERCDVCGSNDPGRTYEWCSRVGRYEEESDFFRACRSCHRRYDNARRKSCG